MSPTCSSSSSLISFATTPLIGLKLRSLPQLKNDSLSLYLSPCPPLSLPMSDDFHVDDVSEGSACAAGLVSQTGGKRENWRERARVQAPIDHLDTYCGYSPRGRCTQTYCRNRNEPAFKYSAKIVCSIIVLIFGETAARQICTESAAAAANEEFPARLPIAANVKERNRPNSTFSDPLPARQSSSSSSSVLLI